MVKPLPVRRVARTAGCPKPVCGGAPADWASALSVPSRAGAGASGIADGRRRSSPHASIRIIRWSVAELRRGAPAHTPEWLCPIVVGDDVAALRRRGAPGGLPALSPGLRLVGPLRELSPEVLGPVRIRCAPRRPKARSWLSGSGKVLGADDDVAQAVNAVDVQDERTDAERPSSDRTSSTLTRGR